MQQQQTSSRQIPIPTRVTFGSSNAQAATSTTNDDPQIAQFSKMFASMLSTEMIKQTNKFKQLEAASLTSKRQNKVLLLEGKRTMALGVFISTHRLDAENIYNELIDGKLHSDMLDQIYKLKLTEDEIEKI
jgi:hypothetical protein